MHQIISTRVWWNTSTIPALQWLKLENYVCAQPRLPSDLKTSLGYIARICLKIESMDK